MNTNPLFIGFDRSPNGEEPEPIELGQHTLLRHFMALGSSGSGKTVLSKILVEEGQTVQTDDPLFVIEAMKMESTITAPVVGVVKKLHLPVKSLVEQDDLIVELE